MWEEYDIWVNEQFNHLQQNSFNSTTIVVKENNRIINRQLKRQIRKYGITQS